MTISATLTSRGLTPLFAHASTHARRISEDTRSPGSDPAVSPRAAGLEEWPSARGGETALSPERTKRLTMRGPKPGENAPAFSPDQKKAAPPLEPLLSFEGELVHLAPAASGPVGMCRLVWILRQGPFLTRPLSGGSAGRFTPPGEAPAEGRAHARGAEGAEVAAAQLPRAKRSGRPRGGRSATLSSFRRPYSGDSSSSSPEAWGTSGGTVTFSGVTSPGMKVMSTSSPGSPSSPRLRPTRIVEPGSIACPST